MGRQRILYKLVGRYTRGNDTVYYSLVSESGKQINYNKEQMAFLVGRDHVVNVKAQLYGDKVRFLGVGVDINSLPVIKLDSKTQNKSENNKTQQPRQNVNTQQTQVQTRTNNRQNTTEKTDSNINKIKEILHIISNTQNFGYKKIPEYTQPDITFENGIIKISQRFKFDDKIRNSEYIIESTNGQIYFRQGEYRDTYICKYENKNLFMSVVLGILGYTKIENIRAICDAEDLDDNISSSFNAYTGASNFYNDILRGLDSKYVDKDSMGIAVVQTVTMLRAYRDIDNNENNKCILFRGGVEPQVGYVDKGFLSFSYSSGISREFISNGQSLIMYMLEDNTAAMNVENIAVCLENGTDTEREILIRPYMTCTAVKQIGYIDGHNFVIAKYAKACGYKGIIKQYMQDIIKYAKKLPDMYIVYQLFNRNPNIEFNGNPYEKLYVKHMNKEIVLAHSGEASYYITYNGEEMECLKQEECNRALSYLFS